MIFWEVYIPENTRFSIETINADVTITGRTKEMKVKSISGFIDLAVPENKQADIDFSTLSGRMYSNHKLAPQGRTSSDSNGMFSYGNDMKALYQETPHNVFLVKFSYWFAL